ncbi:intradiol ring-cleavage dioxygenase [uncultured Lacinutrix sp.]|uniref:dioxygenase family protein n=1 Tax=uncultured Lacinutrix sp. TaxID=574032 RepID=UPI0026363043|nr:intradiol ring-cleavage dioxygenase [uncultured Lacinutrix sp.]
MKREKFIKNLGLGLVATPVLGAALNYSSNKDTNNDCEMTPRETIGPFPLKSPADVVRANIIGDRDGIPLLVNLTIQNVNTNCTPLSDVYVDIWQCDKKGNYSEYSHQLDGNFKHKHFLRGRQTTDNKGNVSFISIYPGWYPGRAPHLHIEVLKKNGKSLLATQIAFPDKISETVYTDKKYKGKADTSNRRDYEFRDSLAGNMADNVTGDNTNGYTLNKVIKVKF